MRAYTGRADLNQIPAELAFQNAIFVPPKVDGVAQMKCVQITTTGVFTVKTHASLALDTAVHLVIHEWAKILIAKCSFAKTVSARSVASHHRHVLQMAFATFVANRAIVRMVLHQALNDRRAKDHGFRSGDGDACTVRCRCHAGHHELACRVLFVAELLDGALPACAYRTQGGMPAEIGEVIAQ